MLILHYNYFNVWYRNNAAMLLMQRCVPFGTRCCHWQRCVSSTRCDSALSLSHCDKSLFCDVLSDIFLFRENCIKKCHSFPLHLSLYFIKYAPSILFLKILKYYNSTILYNSPKKSHFCATFAHSMHIFKYFHTFF